MKTTMTAILLTIVCGCSANAQQTRHSWCDNSGCYQSYCGPEGCGVYQLDPSGNEMYSLRPNGSMFDYHYNPNTGEEALSDRRGNMVRYCNEWGRCYNYRY
jgi:hypothetical protein